MRFSYELPAALIGVAATIVIIQPQIAVAISADEVSRIAKSITVRIESKNPGSGVIIKREGNTYTVLTAAHVVERTGEYIIVTSDDSRYPLNYSTVKKLSGVDLAVVQFTSSKTYTVAKIGNSDQSPEGTAAYVAGFPVASAAINRSIYQFTDGRITANASQPLRDGYALVYSNNTLPGMSGGPVLNEKGEVIGVHGRADTTVANSNVNPNIAFIKTNFNLGIPINTFLRMSSPVGVDVGVRAPSLPARTAPKADDFFIQGVDKYKKGDYRGAVAAYTEAIRLNPNYIEAYNNRGAVRYLLGDKQGAIEDVNQILKRNQQYPGAYINRGFIRSNQGDKRGAIEDYTQAIRLDTNISIAYYNRGNVRSEVGDKQGAIEDYNQAIQRNPNYAPAYINRGNVHRSLGNYQKAIEDYNKALSLNPNIVIAYNNRGLARSDQGDKQGAIEDYTQAIRRNPNYADAYNNRGVDRNDLGDKQGALEDYNQAIRLNPNDAIAYNNRGLVRYNLGDKQGALEDYNQAIRLNPNYPTAYNNRGLVRYKQGDRQRAIEDFNQAIRLNPNNPQAFLGRGLTRVNLLGDKQGGISDLQRAADLFQKQGDGQRYQIVIDLIRSLQR